MVAGFCTSRQLTRTRSTPPQSLWGPARHNPPGPYDNIQRLIQKGFTSNPQSGSESNQAPSGECGIWREFASAREGSNVYSTRCGRIAGRHKWGILQRTVSHSLVYHHHDTLTSLPTIYEHALNQSSPTITEHVVRFRGKWFSFNFAPATYHRDFPASRTRGPVAPNYSPP